MDILVIGAGYAGLVTAAGLADFGHSVIALDIDSDKISALRAGTVPLYEPGLGEMLTRAVRARRLSFIDSYDAVPAGSVDVVFIVVGTPASGDGSVDLTHLEQAVTDIAPALGDGMTVVVKSTVPVGTAAKVRDLIARLRPGIDVGIASNPEFLRQGSAVEDFVEPDRIVVGTESPAVEDVMRHVYRPLLATGIEAVFTTLESAELVKYAANAFLATKLSFVNEIADLCEASGGAVEDVARGMGLDHRIGPHFLRAGPGFGGSCLPKDTQALLHTSRGFGAGSRIVAAALEVNQARVGRMVDRIEVAVGDHLEDRTIALLGLTFKADTDDLRESPALRIARELIDRGATLRVFDPQGMDGARDRLGDGVVYAADEYDAAGGADAVVLATEWKQFGSLSLAELASVLAQPLLIDLRNMWNPDEVAAAGLRYLSIGRPDPV